MLIDLVFIVFKNGSRHLLFYRKHGTFNLEQWWESRRFAADMFGIERVYVETIDLAEALEEEVP